jgi:hypothetical protein
MQEITGDIWELAKEQILIFTSNANLKKDGTSVMGKGIAKEVADRFPEIPKYLAAMIKVTGNVVHCLGTFYTKETFYRIYSFPTKHNWWEKSDLSLIEQSAKQLLEIDFLLNDEVYLPRVGCGNGGLEWEEVKPKLACLGTRFTIVSREEV